MRIVAMLYDQTGRNRKWKIQDGMPLNFKYVYISLKPLIEQRNSNVVAYVLGFQLSNTNSGIVERPSRKKPEMENPRWRPLNFK